VFAMPARTELTGHSPRGEGFGIVFLEAMARGKPVIAPVDGAPAEFIRSGEHGYLIDPVDHAAVAAAVIDLLENPGRAELMGQAAREWVLSEFTAAKFRARLSAALQQAKS
jgi:phosphatidylinositol alpha-1,6-mannosyltransferase